MKYAISLLAAGAVVVRAQDLSSLPACGQVCITNMLSIASNSSGDNGFGCNNGDIVTCACCNPDFGFGVRDCASGACGSDSDYNSVISYGLNYCTSATSSCPSSSTAATSVLTGASTATSTATSGLAAAGAVVTSVSSDAYAVAMTTITAGGDAVSTGGILYSALPAGAGVLVSSGGSSTTVMPSLVATATNATIPTTSAVNSTVPIDTDTATTTDTNTVAVVPGGGADATLSGINTVDVTTSVPGSQSTGGSDSDSSSTSSGGMPMITAAPAFIGAAAMAILAL